MKIKNCVICDKSFKVDYSNGRQANCDEHKGLKKVICDLCGNEFITEKGNRRKTCIPCKSKPQNCGVCGTAFHPNPDAKRLAKYCSTKCQQHAKYKAKYEPKGYNQSGKNNNAYSTGLAAYRSMAYKVFGKICNRCDSKKHLCVHHKDRVRTNNELSNLEVLCRSCHAKEHELKQNFN